MTGLGRSIGLALCCAAALLAIAAPTASAACPNEAIREAQGDTALPACMALELLSPPKKFGQEATEAGGFSPDSTRALYKSKAALADTDGLQSFIGDNYVGLLGIGWTTQPTSPPKEALIQVGGANYGGPYAFSEDFGSWALLGSKHSQQFPAEGQFFTDGLSGSFAPLSPLLVPINNSGDSIQTEIANIAPSGTAADLSASVFPTFFAGTSYFPDDPRGMGPGRNSYLVFRDELGQPRVELLARDGAGTVYGGRCGTDLGNGNLNQGAIAPDGTRIYFTTRPDQDPSVGTDGPPCDTAANPLRIMVREDALTEDATVEELFTTGTGTGDDLYQGASLDSSKVFLMSPRKLATSDQDVTAEACSATVGSSKGCDLYLYDSSLPEAERLIQVSAGGTGDPDPGKGADVLTSTIAIAPDGSHAYFVAQGVLTNLANPQGATATAGAPNLYLYERDAAHPTGETSFVGTLAGGDKGNLWGLARSFANGAYAVPLTGGPQGGDGHILFLTSRAPLTPEADDGGLADIFRYDGDADTLVCATCDAALPATDMVAGPNEALEVPPTSNFAVQGRWASEDGESIVFTTAPPQPEVGVPYLWKEGQLSELPGEVGIESPALRPVLSMDGTVAGFTTTEALLPQDGDTARDVYLARVNGGFLPPPPPPVCNPLIEGNCQGPPSAPGPPIPPGSKGFQGPGNVKPKPPCKKGFVRKRGKCVKKKSNAKAKKQGKAKAGKRANKRQGGSK